MARDELADLLDAAVRLELAISRLYLRYHHDLPDDAAFWWQLAVEEKNHAALLRSLHDLGAGDSGTVSALMAAQQQELQDLTARVEACLVQCAAGPVPRTEAFRCALELEQSAGESHFQAFMEAEPDSALGRVFRTLNRDDMDHAKRVRGYMTDRGLG